MEIAAFLVGLLLYGVGGVIVVLLIIYLILKRIRDLRNEDFEKRDY
ncbi:hypothetical protein AT05_05430 [Schleiferia thermophila str. Yellowstone]|jgi:hypothetical protein|uniref:Uncharacterized protein n=1 Tax=Schleiferia thermophila TaxID=884107 RepID=A0A369A1N0_9FLAO|nr:hypothetical protein AT05_05430 [Schleiferia thermophila str. Yellowstone]RCX03200.1 hypothetical protein DES35_10381 [Schleiferia thermophila]